MRKKFVMYLVAIMLTALIGISAASVVNYLGDWLYGTLNGCSSSSPAECDRHSDDPAHAF